MKNYFKFGTLAMLMSIPLMSYAQSQKVEVTTKLEEIYQIMKQNNLQVSIQLWSVKDQLKADFKGTLVALSEMGFDAVEFAGDFGSYDDNPQKLKQYLESIGLKISGAHVSFQQLDEQHLKKTIEFYNAIECPALIVPYDERAFSKQGIDWVVNQLNDLSRELKPHGIRVGYHNHDQEFRLFKESTYWDYLAKNTDPSVVLQLDVGWARYSENDPVQYVKRYPGRTYTTHYKVQMPDYIKDKLPFVGVDIIEWEKLIKANYQVGGTNWIVIEQEDYPLGLTQLEAVKRSKQNIDAILSKIDFSNLARK